MRDQIKHIILEEFSDLIEKIKVDFKKNYKKKRRNFILSQFDNETTAEMVFVSSFESKSGNTIENCARRFARLKYGDENVPNIINMTGNEVNIKNDNKTQLIASYIDMSNSNLGGYITTFRKNNTSNGRTPSTLNHAKMKELVDIGNNYIDNDLHTKPVDLAFYDGENWNIMEIKAGGDLDSSNAPSNVDKLLTLYTGMHLKNCKAYFATLYNKNGEGRTWNGGVKKYLAYPDNFLIGSQFWNKVLPDNIKFDEFCSIYNEVLEELNLNKIIRDLINFSSED
ncbi:MAG: TdeIII family type II restriction endonuclease [Clostridia bacterium]